MADDADHPEDRPRKNLEPYSLGESAADVYDSNQTDRQAVCDLARNLCELTIPSVMPPDGYRPGQELPGNNQSIGAHCHNNLASKLMFMAFPPGQPMMRLDPDEQDLQASIDQNPALWENTQLALSRLEIIHRKKAASINLSTAWVGFLKALLGVGNCLWKHIKLETPSYWLPDSYIVIRDRAGHPVLVIHKECVLVTTLDDDIQDQIYQRNPKLWKEQKEEWVRKADIYSVQRLIVEGKEKHWEFWQEYEGVLLDGTEVETDYEDAPMWPEWLIPVYGADWGRSYLEEYRGDLFTVESHSSGLNDGAALAAWMLTFVKPGGTTNIRNVKKARNLDILSGNAGDMTVFRSEKGADFNFVAQNLESVARRLAAAFLLQSSIQRDAERVTAEEVTRMGQELDQAMGGLYTQIAQGGQKRMVNRFVRLHEEASPKLPKIPQGIQIQVVTGVDAMGRSIEGQALQDVAMFTNKVFPQQASSLLIPSGVLRAFVASRGLKPDGIVAKPEDVAAANEQQKKELLQKAMVEKATGPLAKGLADHATQMAGQPSGLPPGGPAAGPAPEQ